MRMRFRKAGDFLKDPATPQKLAVCCLVMQPSITLMGGWFQATSMASFKGLRSFIAADGPPSQTERRYFELLSDEHDDFWVPIVRLEPTGWTVAKRSDCMKASLYVLSSLWGHTVEMFDHAPWRWCKSIHDDVPDAEKIRLSRLCRNVNRNRKCCAPD